MGTSNKKYKINNVLIIILAIVTLFNTITTSIIIGTTIEFDKKEPDKISGTDNLILRDGRYYYNNLTLKKDTLLYSVSDAFTSIACPSYGIIKQPKIVIKETDNMYAYSEDEPVSSNFISYTYNNAEAFNTGTSGSYLEIGNLQGQKIITDESDSDIASYLNNAYHINIEESNCYIGRPIYLQIDDEYKWCIPLCEVYKQTENENNIRFLGLFVPLDNCYKIAILDIDSYNLFNNTNSIVKSKSGTIYNGYEIKINSSNLTINIIEHPCWINTSGEFRYDVTLPMPGVGYNNFKWRDASEYYTCDCITID